MCKHSDGTNSKSHADLILTTLKPQLKNVTAEDVASSLYYLHLNTEDDARLLADEQENALSEAPAESNMAREKPLPRKPLSGTARSSIDLNRPGEPHFRRPAVQIPGNFPRKPLPVPARSSLDSRRPESLKNLSHSSQTVASSTTGPELQRKEMASRESRTQPHDRATETVQRKPLGPRPLGSEASIERMPLPGSENHPLNSRPQIQEFAPSKVSSDSVRSDPSIHSDLKTDGPAKSFSFTVIRRDPSSNSQWNIGSVIGEGHSRGMKAMPSSKKPYFDISVHIITPGYTPFRNSQTTSHKDEQPQLHDRQAAVDESGTATSDWGFDRKVCMEGTSFFERPSKQHKRSQSDFSNTLPGTRGKSAAFLSGVRSSDSNADTRDSSSKGYVFLSPWGGRCKFTTGGGGRSLRCKHTLPDSLSSSNAVFESSGSAIVSELRFNLPHYAVFKAHTASKNPEVGSVESGRFSIPKFGHIRNKLSQASRPPLPPRPHPTSYAAMYPSDDEEPPPLPPRAYADDQRVAGSSDEQEHTPISFRSHPGYTPTSPSEDDDERLDLSIGREKAGGGNRGKRAKLGKLIIHDEGFKMLDLVVAANMGVWWSVFDNP